MILKSLSLLNYKNFDSKIFTFNDKINCIVGNNGIGKTNVLDAIYHLSFGKSYFNPVATQNIKHDADFFVINGDYIKHDHPEKIIISLKRGQKKIIKRNGKEYEKFSEHIGFLPLVIISPADRDLITEGSETRRKFIDNVISQSNKAYLVDLINYNKILAQRNALLKYFALNHTFNADTLEIYNNQLTDYGTKIFKKREDFLKEFIPIFKSRYKAISNGNEVVSLVYQSDLFEKINHQFDMIISNPPYIPDDEIVQDIVTKEPSVALYGGKLGVEFYERIIKESINYIKEKALIGFEHGYQQKAQIYAFAKKYYPDSNIIQIKDLQGRDRFTFIGIGGVLEDEKR